MKFFIVLAVVLVVVQAKPGYLGGYPTAAVSHVSRVDFHAKPAVSAYSAPYYSGLGYGLGYGGYAPSGYGYPLAHSYSNRIDIHGVPAPVAIAHGYGNVGYYGGLGYGYGGWDY